MTEKNGSLTIESTLDSEFGAYVSASNSPGLVYGIVEGDELRHANGFGVTRTGGPIPNEHTVFPIASMTKSFTSAAMLICRDRQLLNLDDPVTDYVPELRIVGSPIHELGPTLRMLLSMSSGLTEDNAWVDPQLSMPHAALLEMTALGVRLGNSPGGRFAYSNLGFALAGLAIERVTGESLQEFAARELFLPLGMKETTWQPSQVSESVLAPGHLWNGDWLTLDAVNAGAFAAAGGIASTVYDLTRWVAWLSRAFHPSGQPDNSPLHATSRREMQRDLIGFEAIPAADGSVRPGTNGYGLGLQIFNDLNLGTVVSHAGGLPGYKLFMIWHPASRLGLVVLTNSQRGDIWGMAERLAFELFLTAGTVRDVPCPWRETLELRRRAEGLIRNWSTTEADDIFAKNVAFDRPLADRENEILRLLGDAGTLEPSVSEDEIVLAPTAAEVFWLLRGENATLLCYIDVTPFVPAQVQRLEVRVLANPVTASEIMRIAATIANH